MIAAISLVLSSCTIETSDNGDLDGFWYNRHIDIVTSMEVLYHEWTQP